MFLKIDDRTKLGREAIRILYPGVALGGQDSGLATLGRIDHATIPAGAVVPMHPHVNDEILTYLRRGRVQHTDSGGFTGEINAQRLMLMKAGARFSHEEHVLQEGGQLQGLQIFIRPEAEDLTPEVDFYDLPEVVQPEYVETARRRAGQWSATHPQKPHLDLRRSPRQRRAHAPSRIVPGRADLPAVCVRGDRQQWRRGVAAGRQPDYPERTRHRIPFSGGRPGAVRDRRAQPAL